MATPDRTAPPAPTCPRCGEPVSTTRHDQQATRRTDHPCLCDGFRVEPADTRADESDRIRHWRETGEGPY